MSLSHGYVLEGGKLHYGELVYPPYYGDTPVEIVHGDTVLKTGRVVDMNGLIIQIEWDDIPISASDWHKSSFMDINNPNLRVRTA